jgi:dTDP-4-dehydrorhamnose 3,5-epimerase
MIFSETPLEGAYVIELEKHADERGFFARVFCEQEFSEHGLSSHFVQVNNSLGEARGTLRGLHYQLAPKAEVKLVRCIRGAFYDVIVDLRKNSPTFCRHFGLELTADNRKMLYVPKGFAHGFITVKPDTEALYFVDEFYAPEFERGLRWNDPRLGIDWPIPPSVISGKDRNHPDFAPAYHCSV